MNLVKLLVSMISSGKAPEANYGLCEKVFSFVS